jgi:hypothetical protein
MFLKIECLEFINDPCSHCPLFPCSEAHAPEMRNEVKLMLPQYSPDDSLGKIFIPRTWSIVFSYLLWLSWFLIRSRSDCHERRNDHRKGKCRNFIFWLFSNFAVLVFVHKNLYGSYPDSSRRLSPLQNLKRIYNWKKLKIFLSKISFYLTVDLHKGRQSYRRSLQPSKENIQHFKTWNLLNFFYFYSSFLPSCILDHCGSMRIRIRNTFLSNVVFSWYVVCDQYFFLICRRWNSVWRRGAPPHSGPTGYVPLYHAGLNFRLAHRIYLLGLPYILDTLPVFRIHMFLGLPDPDPLVKSMNPAPDTDSSIIKQK